MILACSSLLAAPCLRAADPKAPDPDLPQPLDLDNVAAPLLDSPPFTRVLDFSSRFALTGIAYVEGKPVATLTDRTTKKSYLVSDQPNAAGWKLAEASASSELRLTQVKINVGSEVVTIHYGDEQIAPRGKGNPKYPTDAEAIRYDNGKPYVRGSAYLSEEEREKYYKTWSREVHEKFRDIIKNKSERLLNASHEEREAYAKKIFNAVDAEEQARAAKK